MFTRKNNANGVQIIGDKVYYKMQHVATLNEMTMSSELQEFKKYLNDWGKNNGQSD